MRNQKKKWNKKFILYINMDGRTDLSIFQLRTGQREKIFYDKEMTYVPTKEQQDIRVFRTTDYQVPFVDNLKTIQNAHRERGSYFNTDPIWRAFPEYVKETTPISRKQAWRIHKAADPVIEGELLSENLRLQAQLFNKNPESMVNQVDVNDELIDIVRYNQDIENEKIVP
jgi:hypothetical protein